MKVIQKLENSKPIWLAVEYKGSNYVIAHFMKMRLKTDYFCIALHLITFGIPQIIEYLQLNWSDIAKIYWGKKWKCDVKRFNSNNEETKTVTIKMQLKR